VSVFLDDRDLLDRFRAGQPQALQHVYSVYRSGVKRIVRSGFLRAAGVRFRGTAGGVDQVDDVVQEVFFRAFSPRARSAYDADRPYAHYLFAIARNELISWHRRRGREVPTESQSLQRVADDLSLQAGRDVRPAMLAALDRIVRLLPAELLGVHERRFVLGWSQRRTAMDLGIGRQTVRTRERYLQAALRSVLVNVDPTHVIPIPDWMAVGRLQGERHHEPLIPQQSPSRLPGGEALFSGRGGGGGARPESGGPRPAG
jgi:RNA polymerase sigma factor (sigma-70 family)